MANLKQSDVQALFNAYKVLGQQINTELSTRGQVSDFDVTNLNTICSTFKTSVAAIGITIS